jgi:hypothetical protein
VGIYKADVSEPYVFYPVETRKGEKQWRVDYKKQILGRIKYFHKIGKKISQKALIRWMISRNANSMNLEETVKNRTIDAMTDLFTDDCLIEVMGEYWYPTKQKRDVKYPPSIYPVEFAIAQAILNYMLSINKRGKTEKNPWKKTKWIGKPALIKYISKMRRDFAPDIISTVIEDMISKNVLIVREPHFLTIDEMKQKLRDMIYIQKKIRETISNRNY